MSVRLRSWQPPSDGRHVDQYVAYLAYFCAWLSFQNYQAYKWHDINTFLFLLFYGYCGASDLRIITLLMLQGNESNISELEIGQEVSPSGLRTLRRSPFDQKNALRSELAMVRFGCYFFLGQDTPVYVAGTFSFAMTAATPEQALKARFPA